MTTLAVRIKQARKQAGLTQKALADAIRVSQPVISQLENGENLQSVHLLSIARACRVHPEWLVSGEGEMEEQLTFSIDKKQLLAAGKAMGMPPENLVGERIRDLMVKRGISENELSKLSGLPLQTVRRILSGESDNPRKSTLEAIARSLGTDSHYLSTGNETAPMFLDDVTLPPGLSRTIVKLDDRFVTIPRFDMAASMGPGIVVPEHLEVIQQLVVDREWIREQRLIHTGVPNLAIITGFGDSMLGTFSDGDPLMVDRGVNSMDKDGIYVFSVDGAAHIKRLQRIGGSRVKVISDNPTYDRWEADLKDIMIHARVLIGLNVRKME